MDTGDTHSAEGVITHTPEGQDQVEIDTQGQNKRGDFYQILTDPNSL